MTTKHERYRAVKRGRKIAVLFVGIVSFFSALLSIYQWSSAPPEPNDIKFVEQDENSRPYIISRNIVESSIVQSDVVISGNIKVPEEFVLVSNNVHFDEGASIVAPQNSKILIVAKDLYGGTVKSNGQAGDKGDDGLNGGEVIVVAAMVDGFSVQAMGGHGGDGVKGPDGADGRDGRCDGFGGWRKANPGQDGGPGGNAGAGGDGGIVRLYTPPNLHIDVQVKGGAPGIPGAPGKGGNGGRGCTGLGGSQASRAPGRVGNAGAAALPGSDGVINRPNRSFVDIAERVQLEIKKGNYSYRQLLTAIEAQEDAGND